MSNQLHKPAVNKAKEFEWPDETFMRELWDYLGAVYCEWGYSVNHYPIDYNGELGLKKARLFCDTWNEEAGHLLFVEDIAFEADSEDKGRGTIVVKYKEIDSDYVPESVTNRNKKLNNMN